MAIALVQSATGRSSTATTTAAFSTAPTSGNLVVLAFASDDYNGTPNTGWTQSAEMEQQTFHGGYVWWRISDGSNSLQYTIGSATSSSWVLLEFSGVDPTPYDISEGQFQQTSTSSYTSANITPSTGDRLLLAAFGGSHSSQDISGAYSSWLNSFTAIANIGQSSGAATCMGTAYRLVTGDGSTAFSTGVNYPNVVQSKSAMIIAFKAAAGGAGGITGSSSITEAGDSVSSASALAIKGTVSATEASDTVTSAGTVALKGAVSATEASDTVSSAAKVAIAGSLAATEADDTINGSAALAVTGTSTTTEDGDTLSASGLVVTAGPVAGEAAIIEEGDTLQAAGAQPSEQAVEVNWPGTSIPRSRFKQMQRDALVRMLNDQRSKRREPEPEEKPNPKAIRKATRRVLRIAIADGILSQESANEAAPVVRAAMAQEITTSDAVNQIAQMEERLMMSAMQRLMDDEEAEILLLLAA